MGLDENILHANDCYCGCYSVEQHVTGCLCQDGIQLFAPLYLLHSHGCIVMQETIGYEENEQE